MYEILPVETPEMIAEIRRLFLEYETWLNVDLCFQGFEEEVNSLPGKYSPPDGRLYIVKQDGSYKGCIALRKIEDGICEMKRLYLNESARGKGIGNKLIKMIIQDAMDIGYNTMRLDTIKEKMPKAVSLYESHGFRELEPYYNNPNPHTLFMELQIDVM